MDTGLSYAARAHAHTQGHLQDCVEGAPLQAVSRKQGRKVKNSGVGLGEGAAASGYIEGKGVLAFKSAHSG